MRFDWRSLCWPPLFLLPNRPKPAKIMGGAQDVPEAELMAKRTISCVANGAGRVAVNQHNFDKQCLKLEEQI